MTIESSLNYQKNFFNEFSSAWDKQSTYRLYKGIDTTAENLRLDLEDTPGYILAYDKDAQTQLRDFLQHDLVKFVRKHVPFFEVDDDGTIFFGDWYHRRQFGQLNIITREINQQSEGERAILPQLETFAENPDHYLDNQIEAMRKQVYRDVDRLHQQVEEANTQPAPEPVHQQSSGSFRSLLKNFVDPSEDEPKKASPKVPVGNPTRLKARFDAAKEAADLEFDAKKRQLQVNAAVTRYEYQAVMNTYSSVTQFENVLANLKLDFMRALELEEERHA